MRRLEATLAGFERTRRYETFTDARHKETLELNERLADEVETLERKLHQLTEENRLLKAAHSKKGAMDDDEIPRKRSAIPRLARRRLDDDC